jgi:alpha-amylase/alpha-mannosidase (GH57 family)
MAKIRIVLLWHMHQPFYKDLVTGNYRLPWVRLHALKDYYGMVKLVDEFPDVHQTFNLVPSLVTQIEDYVSGKARDPFLDVAAKPASELSSEERRFALAYLFQANPVHMIARYPRYEELHLRFHGAGENPERALPRFDPQDLTDLQVLSQLAWFDEFFLQEPAVAELVRKGRDYSLEDQSFVVGLERELISRVLPAYAEASRRGSIEISTSPYYHPILPLLCDTDMGGVSTPGLKLPQNRFQHPEDARTQLERGLALHERVFGVRPRGAWPSEGSLSDQVLRIAAEAGLEWMASDEGVLSRSIDYVMRRDGNGVLHPDSADRLYRIYRFESGAPPIYLFFRDHALSDLIGFVYSGMPPKAAAESFLGRIRECARPLLAQKRDAIVPVILDGENAWEYYPQSGREFLRRFYDGIARDPQMEAVTAFEAIREEESSRGETPRGGKKKAAKKSAKAAPPKPPEPATANGENDSPGDRRRFVRLSKVMPGSWIHANFNVWIGAPEDNRSWDYLSAARDYYANYGMTAGEEQRALAFEELLIAEGSDWNWWYGPEHHTANDRDFDELYRKHLSNVYLALGARPPDCLAQPIAAVEVRPSYAPQAAYIHPRVDAPYERYFDWIGAAMYSSDRRAGAMHGKQFLLDSVRAGIDETNLYGRLDFAELPDHDFELRVNFECLPPSGAMPDPLTLEVTVEHGAISSWRLRETDNEAIVADSAAGPPEGFVVSLRRNFGFQVPLSCFHCVPQSRLRLRVGLWHNRLPLDALPIEGWVELLVVPEEDLEAGVFNYSASS